MRQIKPLKPTVLISQLENHIPEEMWGLDSFWSYGFETDPIELTKLLEMYTSDCHLSAIFFKGIDE